MGIVLVNVLQKNRTNRMWEWSIRDTKRLTIRIGSHNYGDWQVPRSSQQTGGPRELIHRSSQKASLLSLGTQEERMFHLALKAGKDYLPAQAAREFPLIRSLCSSHAFHWLDEAHPHHRGPSTLLSYWFQSQSILKHPHRHTRVMSDQLSEQLSITGTTQVIWIKASNLHENQPRLILLRRDSPLLGSIARIKAGSFLRTPGLIHL